MAGSNFMGKREAWKVPEIIDIYLRITLVYYNFGLIIGVFVQHFDQMITLCSPNVEL